MEPKKMRMFFPFVSSCFGLLLISGNIAYPEENRVIGGLLPLCADQLPSIEVLAGDTLISLARRMTKPAVISHSEWIEFIYEKNRDIFIDNNKNRLPVGAILAFPCSEFESDPEKQPDSTDGPVVVSLFSKIQEMEATITQIRRLVEDQTENQVGLWNLWQEQSGFFKIAVFALMGLLFLLLVVLIACLYRWYKVLLASVEQTPHELRKIKQFLPEIYSKIEKAGSRTVSEIANDAVVDGVFDGTPLRDYLKRLVPVDIAIDDFMRDKGNDSKALKVIKVLVEDALHSCGVGTFSPAIGADYRSVEGVADYPKTRVTDKPEDKFKIAEILEKGYHIKTSDGYDVIRPARVRIFTTN